MVGMNRERVYAHNPGYPERFTKKHIYDEVAVVVAWLDAVNYSQFVQKRKALQNVTEETNRIAGPSTTLDEEFLQRLR
jgi:hypothetical protein